MSSRERIVELLNDASIATDTSKKLESLRKVQELLVHKEPVLLDNFLDEMMGFSQNNHNQEVRKFVVGFIEEAAKKDPEILPDVIMNIQIMMEDDDLKAVAVQKRVIQAMTQIYKIALSWLSKAKTVSEQMEATWSVICHIKEVINLMLEHSNDGVRTHTIKFMEMLVVTQTHIELESIKRPNDFSLDDVPLTLKVVRPRKLEEEARNVFEELIKLHGSEHISSANLMTCMGSLSNIAKIRPEFMPKVITALEMLQANLPPTLAKSQVSSVRKHLKNQLLSLLKHKTAAENFFTNITTLLTDLGAGKEEVMKAMPKFDEMKRRARKVEAAARRSEKSKALEPDTRDGGYGEREDYETSAQSISGPIPAKRIKVDIPDASDSEESEDEKMDVSEKSGKKFSASQTESAVDITEKFIIARMNPLLAAEIVLKSMNRLPQDIPAQFHHTYTPIAAAGTEGQVKHVSRLLAAQLTAANIGPGIDEMKERKR
jgi:symplekin